MSYAEQFRQFEVDKGKDMQEINAVWFRDNDASYPTEYIGEDLLNDIINKFYEPLAFIRQLVEKDVEKALDIRITIMPSYEDVTIFVVTLNSEKVLAEDSWKAWHFWFTDERFNDFVTEQLSIWKQKVLS